MHCEVGCHYQIRYQFLQGKVNILGKEKKRMGQFRIQRTKSQRQNWKDQGCACTCAFMLLYVCTCVPPYTMIGKTSIIELFFIAPRYFQGSLDTNFCRVAGVFIRVAMSAQHKEKWIFRKAPNDEGTFGCCLH